MKNISFLTLLVILILNVSPAFSNTTFTVEGSLGQSIDKDGNLTTKIFTQKHTFNILTDEEINSCLSGKFEIVSDYPFFAANEKSSIGNSYYLVYIIECNEYQRDRFQEEKSIKFKNIFDNYMI